MHKQILGGGFIFFFFHPYLGKIPILTSIFFNWVETTTQDMVEYLSFLRGHL